MCLVIRDCGQRSGSFTFNFHVSSSRFYWPFSVTHPVLVSCSRMLCCDYDLHKISSLCCVFAQDSFEFESLSLPYQRVFISLHSTPQNSCSWLLISWKQLCFLFILCCLWPFVFSTSCGQWLPWEGHSCSVTKMIGGVPPWEGIDQSLHKMTLNVSLFLALIDKNLKFSHHQR